MNVGGSAPQPQEMGGRGKDITFGLPGEFQLFLTETVSGGSPIAPR